MSTVRVVTALAPGKWNADEELWKQVIGLCTEAGAKHITMTEAHHLRPYRDVFPEAWDGERGTGAGPGNTMQLWDTNTFQRIIGAPPYTKQMTTVQLFTKSGHPLPFSYGLVCPLELMPAKRFHSAGEHEDTLFASAHLPLENTTNRRKAKRQAIKAVHELWSDGRVAVRRVRRNGFGDEQTINRYIASDWNRSAKQAPVRDWFKEKYPRLIPSFLKGLFSTHGNLVRGGMLDWMAATKGWKLVSTKRIPSPNVEKWDHHITIAVWEVTV